MAPAYWIAEIFRFTFERRRAQGKALRLANPKGLSSMGGRGRYRLFPCAGTSVPGVPLRKCVRGGRSRGGMQKIALSAEAKNRAATAARNPRPRRIGQAV